MSEAEETPSAVFYPQRAAGLRRRWGGDEPLSVSPLCAASVPFSVASPAVSIPEPASTPIMARAHAAACNNNPTTASSPFAATEDDPIPHAAGDQQKGGPLPGASSSTDAPNGGGGPSKETISQGSGDRGTSSKGSSSHSKGSSSIQTKSSSSKGSSSSSKGSSSSSSSSKGSSNSNNSSSSSKGSSSSSSSSKGSSSTATKSSSSNRKCSSSSSKGSSSSSRSSSKGIGFKTAATDPILNPDGITVKKPPKLGFSSGDPVAAHILKTKSLNFSARLAPRPSRLNLSIHRRTGVASLRGPLGGPQGPPGASRRSPFAAKESESLPKLVQFSPSLKSVLSQDFCGMRGDKQAEREGDTSLDGERQWELETEKERQILKANPSDAEACYRLGVLLFRKGDTLEAIQAVQDFLEAFKNSNKAVNPNAETLNPNPDRGDTTKRDGEEQQGRKQKTAAAAAAAAAKDDVAAVDTPKPQQTEEEGSHTLNSDSTAAAAAISERKSSVSEEKSSVSEDKVPVSEDKPSVSEDKSIVSEDKSIVSDEKVLSPCEKEVPASSSSGAVSAGVSPYRLLDQGSRGVCALRQLAGIVLDYEGHASRRSSDFFEGWSFPRFQSLEKLLGHLYFEHQDFPRAIRRYWRAIDLDPKDAQMFTSLGLAYYELEELEHAAAAFEHSLTLDEKNTTALSVLAMLLLDKVTEEEDALMDGSDEAAAGESATQETDRVTRIREATNRCLELLQKCLSFDKDNVLARLHLAQVLSYREQWTESEAVFRSLLKEMPGDTHILNNIGQVAFHQGDLSTAVHLHQQVLGINPEDELAHMYLCEAFCALNKYKEALDHFILCCKSSPDSVALHASCGLPLCEVGQEQQVIDAYTAFIKQHPDSVAAKAFKRTLGSVDDQLGFFESASIISYIVVPVLLVVALVFLFFYHPLWTGSDERPPIKEADSHFGEF